MADNEAETTHDEFAELCCPLPAIRQDIDTDELMEHHCGERLFVERLGGSYLLAGGECEGDTTWKVTCANGHVLVVDDHEGNDRSIPFDAAIVQKALEGIGVVASGGGGMAFKPLGAKADG